MSRKLAIAAGLAIGLLSSTAFADSSSARYVSKRVGMGPRPDQYTLVRVDRDAGDRPYALTGDSERPARRRVVIRFAGPHYIGPVTAWE